MKNVCKTFEYDFKYKNKIIEFNGDYWHRNPRFYSQHKEILERDEYKEIMAKENGFEYLIIWEYDYIHNRKEVLNKCKTFINGK